MCPYIVKKMVRATVWNFVELDAVTKLDIKNAVKARENAYAPISHFTVGAIVEFENGKKRSGCNCETDTLTEGCHAEDNAITTGIHDFSKACKGKVKIIRVTIVLGPEDKEITLPPEVTEPLVKNINDIEAAPCGRCLSIIWQHCQGDVNVEIVILNYNGQIIKTTIGSALPFKFHICH